MGKDRLLREKVRENGKETNKANDKSEVDNSDNHGPPLLGSNQVMVAWCLR